MRILTDLHGRGHTYLRISVTERCNLRCRYCMPEEGVPLSPKDAILSFEEIERLAQIFVRNGITKIRVTGGEPLVRKDIELLMARLGSIAGLRHLAMTTNGLLLDRKLDALISAGLSSINISLDTLREDRFREITRRPGLNRVLAAIDKTLATPLAPVKVNCVVVRSVNDDEVLDFVELTKSLPIEMRFIEYMPFSGNGWDHSAFVSFAEMRQQIELVYGPLERRSDGPNDTSKTFGVPDFRGSLGFITSMSEHFCDTCNRLRITADGNLKVCLFGSAEVSLRDLMRRGATDSDIEDCIDAAVKRKAPRHAGMDMLALSEDRPMILIGG